MPRNLLGAIGQLGRMLAAAAWRVFFAFDATAVTFTPSMAKRLPPAGPFAAAPLVQGDWAQSNVSD